MADHGDKRSVSTDALETLGTIIGEGQGRDAIHLAVEPAVAAVALSPGEDVGFVPGGVGPCDHNIGIVDPFLKAPVLPGNRFWLVIYPRKITSLRHVWTHPDIPDEASRVAAAQVADRLDGASRAWLVEFAERLDLTYNALMEAAELWVKDGEYTVQYGSEHWRDTFWNHGEDFWTHYEKVVGVKIASDKREAFFSCSC